MSSEAQGIADRELIASIRAELRRLEDPEKAVPMRAYLKSEMPLLGVQTPQHRKACRVLFRRSPMQSAADWRATALALWREAEYREERYCALNLLNHPPYHRFRSLDDVPMIEEMVVTGAWWDLVDNLVPYAFVDLLEEDPEGAAAVLRRWAVSDDVWTRRAAIISQLKRKEATDLDLLFDCVEPSIRESEFFLRKGIGWALREQGKTHPEEITAYVSANRDRLSPLSKREALRNLLTKEDLIAFLAD